MQAVGLGPRRLLPRLAAPTPPRLTGGPCSCLTSPGPYLECLSPVSPRGSDGVPYFPLRSRSLSRRLQSGRETI